MTYSIEHIDPDHPPKPTKYLHRQVLCGLCNFKCCRSKGLSVECTKIEAKKLDLPIIFQQDGHCRCLTPTGCKHGENRPVFCKLFPLQVLPPRGQQPPSLVVSHWSILNCPAATDYIFDGVVGGKYTYHRKKVSGAKKNNSQETLELDEPLSDFPAVLDFCGEAVDELYGEGTVAKLKDALNPPSFGLVKKPEDKP